MILNLGNTALRYLEEFHYFRENFNFLYFCPRCCRNFETFEAVNNCKFCSGFVRLLQHKEKKGQQIKKYNYFCEKCGKIESGKRMAECPTCKGSAVPVYRWDELNLGDRMFVWFSKMSRNLPAVKTKKASMTPARKSMFSFNMPRLSFMPIFTRKSKEELPTY